mgnify:CR=1 FL=1
MLTKGQRLLAAFTAALNKHDVVRFALNGQTPAYEIEAISLLAGFNEAHIGMLDDDDQYNVAMAVTAQEFARWHGPGKQEALHAITCDLVVAYCAESAED